MSRSGSLHQAKGKKFTNQLLYVQHVDKEKDTASTISEQSLDEYLLNNSKIFSDSDFAEYLRNPKANVGILKSSLQDEVVQVVHVCTNPLPIPLKSGVTIHAFVILWTQNLKTNEKMWYSMEKNGQYIVIQQSPIKKDVEEKLYDPEEKELVERLGPVERECFARGNGKDLEYLIRAIWKTKQLSTKYHLLFSNCQNFAEFVLKEASLGGKKWTTPISWIGRNKKSQTEIEADTLKYIWIKKDDKYVYYKAMAEGRRQDFEELAKNNLTSESLNSVDSQGYTLLEWATVFSTSHWPIDQFLIEKGAEIQTDDEGLFRRNVFFIALQYLPSKKESRYLSFDGINIHGVNQTGDSALHLALDGKKWDVAERILNQFPDYDVNATNFKGYTPLHLAVHPKCKMVLIKKILAKTNSKSVNAQNVNGWTALHVAIDNQSEIAVKKLLKRDDVGVNLKNNINETALHYASLWKDMSINLFKKILEKSTDVVNAQDKKDGWTALHYAIRFKSETATKQLLECGDVKVNLKNDDNQTALHFAAEWKNMPVELFRVILGKSTDVNAQEKDGDTALHWAIAMENRTAVEELLKRKDVDVNLKDCNNFTILHVACVWKNIPIDLFKLILCNSTDFVNAQDIHEYTALHFAIIDKSETATKQLLEHNKVDVNLKNDQNLTALHSAAICRTPIDLFRVILGKSADVNAHDEYGDTALSLAIMCKSETALKELLKRDDVDVNLKNNYNQTALNLAAQWKDIPIDLFRVILEKSTDVNAQDEDGDTALHWAIIVENRTAMEELLKRDDVKVTLKNNQNRMALNLCSDWKDIPIDLFKLILGKSADVVNAQDEGGHTALHGAIGEENETVVGELLKCKDVDFNIKNNDNQTALHFATRWVDIPVVLFRVILEKSTNVNAQDEVGHTSLHLAIEQENRTAVEELLKRDNVDLKLKNNYNRTALNLCSMWKDIPAHLLKIINEKTTAENEAT